MRKHIVLLKTLCILFFIMVQINLNAQINRVKYNLKGNLYTYYALSRDSATHISVTGPGKLKITTHARFTTDSPDSLSYAVVYYIDNTDIKLLSVKNVFRAGKDVYIQSIDDRPSTSKTHTLKVDTGAHIFSFYMLNKTPQIDLHYKFVPDSVVEWKDKPSLTDTSEISIKIDKSSTKSYYRFSAEQPQKFKVKGPTSLRVLTRLEYSYTMQGLISYMVSVKRNDTIIGTFKLEANPSQEAQYESDKKLIPGTLEEFFLEVPAGENYYEFSLLDKKYTALIRVSKGSKVKRKDDKNNIP